MLKKLKQIFFGTKKKQIVFSCAFLFLLILIFSVTIILMNLKPKYKMCHVLFDVTGGTQIEEQQVKCGDVIQKPEDPSKNGFDFNGWFLNNKEYDFNSSLTEDIVLKAKWTNNNTESIFSITFLDDDTTIEVIEIAEGEKLTAPIPPTKNGYIFKGWFIGDDLYDFSYTIHQNLTLVAYWEKEQNNEKSPNNEKPIEESHPNNQTSTDSENIDDLVNQLLGDWYFEIDSNVFLKVYYTYINNEKVLYFDWGNIDLYKNVLYPNYSTLISKTLSLNKDSINSFLEETHIKMEDNQLRVGQYLFTKNKKELDLSQFDKYLGMWYLTGQEDNNVFIMIQKDDDNYFRISTEKEQFIGEQITMYEIYEGTHIFQRHNIRYENGFLIYNGQKYSKEKNKEVIPLESFRVNFGMNTTNIVYPGKTIQYSVEFYPENATNLNGTWFSQDENIAKVDSNSGLVTGVNLGYTNICFTSSYNYQTECESVVVEDLWVEKIIPVHDTIELYVGETKNLEYNVEPKDATNKKMYYYSTEPIVSFDENTITGISEGKTTIEITYSLDSGITATMTVIVKKAPDVSVNGVTLNKTKENMLRGDTIDLVATISPDNATNKNLSWTSSNPSVATVSNTGKVTAIQEGNATITVKTLDGNFTATADIIVKNPPLVANPSVGLSYTCTNSQCGTYTFVKINASGGSGIYEYTVDIKKDGSSLGIYTSDATYFPITKGEFEITYTVQDSLGNKIQGTYNSTIS